MFVHSACIEQGRYLHSLTSGFEQSGPPYPSLHWHWGSLGLEKINELNLTSRPSGIAFDVQKDSMEEFTKVLTLKQSAHIHHHIGTLGFLLPTACAPLS